MLDVFSPLSLEARRAQHAAYRQFLLERDGDLDLTARTLSLRESGMARYAKPLPRVREIDQALFQQQYARFDVRRRMSGEAGLLLALVKANAAEAYGVTQTFDTVYRRAQRVQDDVEVLMLVEETYHTRILLSAAVLFGLDITTPFRPAPPLRALISGISRGPDSLSRPLVLAGEIVGAVTFLNLFHKAREVLGHDPELRDAMEERVMEVLTDEIGHISFNRMLLGPAGLRTARVLLPLVSKALSIALPELGALGLHASAEGAEHVTTSHALPDAVRRAAFVA
ncbi:MAG TPA: hypothetical protein VJV78_49470 [Polyangiales bacterium]|nr:hypothetical protein [Polyangiales bacterium]